MKKTKVDLAVMYQTVIFNKTGIWIDYEEAVQTLKEAAKG